MSIFNTILCILFALIIKVYFCNTDQVKKEVCWCNYHPNLSCCTTTTISTLFLSKPSNFESQIECGYQIIKQDRKRIYGGLSTKIGEFPWMVLIYYGKSADPKCIGSIIHEKFILTVAHCITGSILGHYGNPTKVRVGEHDLSTDPDCWSNSYCAPPVTNENIEQLIPHPKYLIKNDIYYNDIGLIRLTKFISFSDYIRPICLPSSPIEENTKKSFIISGWGETETFTLSPIKLKSTLYQVDRFSCQDIYRNKFNLKDDQICAGGQKGIDSCRGDSGGPLMYLIGNKWILYGLVSIGPNKCGMENIPGIYTNVIHHLNWIYQQMNK